MGCSYRIRQFWHSITSKPGYQDLERIGEYLTTSQLQLFRKLSLGEQAHSIRVFIRLIQQNETDYDLLVAALLHDIGKTIYPLNNWERVFIVLAEKLFPQYIAEWGCVDTEDGSWIKNWRRPLVIAKYHPSWGAELAEETNVSQNVLNLIRFHQDYSYLSKTSIENEWMNKLQIADRNS